MKILRYKVGNREWPIVKHKSHVNGFITEAKFVEDPRGDLNYIDDRAALWIGTGMLSGIQFQRTTYFIDGVHVSKGAFQIYIRGLNQLKSIANS